MLAAEVHTSQIDFVRTYEKQTRELAIRETNSFAKRKGKRKSSDSQAFQGPECMIVTNKINVHSIEVLSDDRVEHVSPSLIADCTQRVVEVVFSLPVLSNCTQSFGRFNCRTKKINLLTHVLMEILKLPGNTSISINLARL